MGEHIATVDFVRCLQNKNLLQTGEYIVISVDDEIYDPLQRVKFMDRGEWCVTATEPICLVMKL